MPSSAVGGSLLSRATSLRETQWSVNYSTRTKHLVFHTRRSGDVEQAAQIYLHRMGGFEHLGLQLGAMSRGARLLRGFAEGGDPAQFARALSPSSRTCLLYEWGLYAGALCDLELALRCYGSFNQLVRTIPNMAGLSTGLRTSAYTARLKGALDDALAFVEAAEAVATRASLLDHVVRAIALRASVLNDFGSREEAGREFLRARALGDRPFARRALWEAEHTLDSGRVEDAITMTQQSLAGLDELGWKGHMAHAHVVLGLALLRRPVPELRQARHQLELASSWTRATGEVEVVLRCLELEARLYICEENNAGALATIAVGRELAQTCNFGLAATRFEEVETSVRGVLPPISSAPGRRNSGCLR
jgi:tetratricopeptide (TPR) repeat protein